MEFCFLLGKGTWWRLWDIHEVAGYKYVHVSPPEEQL